MRVYSRIFFRIKKHILNLTEKKKKKSRDFNFHWFWIKLARKKSRESEMIFFSQMYSQQPKRYLIVANRHETMSIKELINRWQQVNNDSPSRMVCACFLYFSHSINIHKNTLLYLIINTTIFLFSYTCIHESRTVVSATAYFLIMISSYTHTHTNTRTCMRTCHF